MDRSFHDLARLLGKLGNHIIGLRELAHRLFGLRYAFADQRSESLPHRVGLGLRGRAGVGVHGRDSGAGKTAIHVAR